MSGTDPSVPEKDKGARLGRNAPRRKSIMDRIANKVEDTNPLVVSSVDTLGTVGDDTGTFTIDMTGELVIDPLAPLPLADMATENLGEMSLEQAATHHLLLVPDTVLPAEIEALAVTVWNEAGWLSPGNLRLRQGSTLEGPWTLSGKSAEALGLSPDIPLGQVYMLQVPATRGAAPTEEVKQFSELARAFPDGMPVGVEDRVITFLQSVCRRLEGALRIAGSGHLMQPVADPSVNLRVFASSWLSPDEMMEVLSPHFPGLWNPSPPPMSEGGPFALMAPIASRSQILIGTRLENYAPRALRWEIWAKERVFVYEIVWVRPDDLAEVEEIRTRSGRLERSRAAASVETAAAVLADKLNDPLRGGAAIIDEDQFLVGLDVPPLEEESPRP